ncbi:NAD-dependent epimerase/dehydratase [Catenulispora acidiphila DSM 44928]|uniref:NAD-dependent epimerase/dehydratase n=1 Tax=Catenulispora acidiphila (strain DSM 44928 / JCM 14897 / NBRC 102108 / NRRL B-24433 / ID139908) TaxID=479433 RepID=C7PZV2_CATAD|nr:NAD-dependent epimerase/dehydratase family protein [Catenulispora acidiphila]ACU73617.1 NAD-dependent epimerase/dehydratase [Catenulispora acidiphila DSM 44928]
MRILMLGGTGFVGRAVVEDALARGHDVTIFSRGRSGAGLFPQVARLVGDRDGDDYAALATGAWDAVVDSSAYVPRHVNNAMDALGDRVGRYVFVSSHAVYPRRGVAAGSTEDTPRRAPVRDTEELLEETYGPLKVACEDDIQARFGERASIVRLGKVAGPHDPQNGLTYYVRRAAAGGRLALPGRPEQPVQLIDSRDAARLMVRLIEDDRGGAFNAVGPGTPITLADTIHICARVAGTEVEIVPVPEQDAQGTFFPLIRDPAEWNVMQRDPARAVAAGMPQTPFETTVADVLAWDRERGTPPLKFGFTAEEEAKALAEAK